MNTSFSLKEFLKTRNEFRLGNLTTEKLHPLTKNLSQINHDNPANALTVLKRVDQLALEKLLSYDSEIYELQVKCQQVLKDGGRIFLCGCGATGRLALSLEKISFEMNLKGSIISFMAGGDFALIKSVESFEDRRDFGAKQLKELGFNNRDLLLGITEGGETSFVIGAVEFAKKHSLVSPYFIYCNPDSELAEIERSHRILRDSSIYKLNLTVGPMALSGSTRMQATTVQMITCGVALFFEHQSFESFKLFFHDYCSSFIDLEVLALKPFIETEADLYISGGIITYKACEDIAIAVLTDTTERSPTFSLDCFEQEADNHLSLSYLAVKETQDSAIAWRAVLGRNPRILNWRELNSSIGIDDLYAFDISENSYLRREKEKKHKIFKIEEKPNILIFEVDDLRHEFKLKKSDLLFKHVALKILLNSHSTLVMGLINRFEGNMMTYVKASNFKLVDRTIRYVQELIGREGIEFNEALMAEFIYQYKSKNKPIVLELRDYCKSQKKQT